MSEDKNMQLSNYVVAFIDILGQSAKLNEYPLLPSKEKRDKHFKEWIKSTYGLVNNFSKVFKSYFDGLSGHKYQNFDTKRYSVSNISISSLSDSLLLYSSLKENQKTIPIFDVLHLLSAISCNFILFLSQKISFRVGIDIGIGMELDNVGLYGSAIAKAYSIESNKAIYPRIVVGKDLHSYIKSVVSLDNASEYKGDEYKFKLSKSFASLILKDLLLTDFDGEVILNYLAPHFIDRTKEIGMAHIIDDAGNFIEESIGGNLDYKIKCKYLYLKDFFEKYLK